MSYNTPFHKVKILSAPLLLTLAHYIAQWNPLNLPQLESAHFHLQTMADSSLSYRINFHAWFTIIRTGCFSNTNYNKRLNFSLLLLILSINFYVSSMLKEEPISSISKLISPITKWKSKIKRIPKIPSLKNNYPNNKSSWNYCHRIKSQIHIQTFSKITNKISLQALVAEIPHLWPKIYTFQAKIPYKKYLLAYLLHNFLVIIIYAPVLFILPKLFKPFG